MKQKHMQRAKSNDLGAQSHIDSPCGMCAPSSHLLDLCSTSLLIHQMNAWHTPCCKASTVTNSCLLFPQTGGLMRACSDARVVILITC